MRGEILRSGPRLPINAVMPKFERLTFPPAQPDARLARIIAPSGRITRRAPLPALRELV
ncbi:hypothetical protein ACQP2E_16265 [Actinoplanes sp. CA-015351]|uniref:hypothetical protein n=1 Tax=Actinoplanes sp. CA-015351 TaxID=3239897 RepID=UPI003D98A39C